VVMNVHVPFKCGEMFQTASLSAGCSNETG